MPRLAGARRRTSQEQRRPLGEWPLEPGFHQKIGAAGIGAAATPKPRPPN